MTKVHIEDLSEIGDPVGTITAGTFVPLVEFRRFGSSVGHSTVHFGRAPELFSPRPEGERRAKRVVKPYLLPHKKNRHHYEKF